MKQLTKRWYVCLTLVILFVLGICLLFYLQRVYRYKSMVQTITYTTVDLAQLEDGTYIGKCDVDFIRAEVAVTVEHGIITDIILLEHKNERGVAAEQILSEIVAKQEIMVDTITGATNSSKVIQKAIENALTS